jgi:hypothetical protein
MSNNVVCTKLDSTALSLALSAGYSAVDVKGMLVLQPGETFEEMTTSVLSAKKAPWTLTCRHARPPKTPLNNNSITVLAPQFTDLLH